MKKNEKIAVYSGTKNTYATLLPSVYSLYTNTNVDKIYLLIEDDIFPYKLPKIVQTINVSSQDYFKPDGPNYNSKWSYMVLLRAAYTKLFPQHDKILSLDIDTYVDANIDEIWDIPIDEYYYAASHEVHITRERNDLYVNFGVSLHNLKKLREDHKDDELIEKLQTTHYTFCEQDCINELCSGRIYDLPSIYNVSAFTEIPKTPKDRKIIHYAAINNLVIQPLYLKYWNEYLMWARTH